MSSIPLHERVVALVRRDDFQRNPVTAIRRRISWRLMWRHEKSEVRQVSYLKGMSLVLLNDGYCASLYYQCSFDKFQLLLERILPVDGLLVDCGAYIGAFSITGALIAKRGYVIGFEPNPLVAGLAKRNAELNGLASRITIEACALWRSNDELTFFIATPAHDSRVVEGERLQVSGTIKVKAITLDDYLARMNGPNVSFLKLDAEGAEGFILEGAEQLLRDQHPGPTVLFEYYPTRLRESGLEPTEVLSRLRSWGYHIFEFESSEFENPVQLRFVPGDVIVSSDGFTDLVATKDPSQLVKAGLTTL